MNIFFKATFFAFLCLIVVSCSKSDSSSAVNAPLRDYTVQYTQDISDIETYMKTHYMEVIDNPGASNDLDVTYFKMPSNGSKISIWDQTKYPKHERYVWKNNVKYTIYYIELRQGTGASPCNVDKVLTSYRGEYIYPYTEKVGNVDVTTPQSLFFEESINPQSAFSLTDVITGWSEIFPQFKTGSYTDIPGEPALYSGFGAGVLFIPSGLAYYNVAKSTILAYSPLIFSFKLYAIERTDQDGDGIPSYLEDIGASPNDPNRPALGEPGYDEYVTTPDGYVRVLSYTDKDHNNAIPADVIFNSDGTTTIFNPDNSDWKVVKLPDGRDSQVDKKPDFADFDDDGDYFTTASEIKNPATGLPFSFNDIPTCDDGKKKHLSVSCH